MTTRIEENLLFKKHASEYIQHRLDTKQMKQPSEWVVEQRQLTCTCTSD